MEPDAKKYEVLISLAALLSEIDDYNESTRLISHRLMDIFDSEIVSLIMLKPESSDIVKTIVREEKNSTSSQLNLLLRSIAGWIIKNRNSFISNSIYNDNRFRLELLEADPIKNFIGVPIFTKKTITGTVIIGKDSEKLFNDSDLDLLEKTASIISPFINNLEKISEYFNPVIPDEELISKYEKLGLVGKCEEFMNLIRAIESASKCDVRVLLIGETGTGKELIAKAIHKLSLRNEKNFVVIDCGSIHASLIDSELFGYVKGAFTGAFKGRIGLFEEGNGGTIFIDEINLLPLELQSKLLRLVQEGEYRSVGSNTLNKIDIRIIAASSVNLYQQVKAHNFREELFYRLNVYPIKVPSLETRHEDIPTLITYFVNRFSEKYGKKIKLFDLELMDILKAQRWKGNIRELENYIERLITSSSSIGSTLKYCDLSEEIKKELETKKNENREVYSSFSLNKKISGYEEQIIREALIMNNWNQSKAAASLDIPEQTLRYKMKKYRLVKPDE